MTAFGSNLDSFSNAVSGYRHQLHLGVDADQNVSKIVFVHSNVGVTGS